MDIKHMGIESIQEVVKNKQIKYEIVLKPNYSFESTGTQIQYVNEEDIEEARKLQAEKYSRWDWNFGENPSYAFIKAAKFPAGLIEVQMNISQEVIHNVRITGDFFAFGEISELEQALCGVPHRVDAIETAIRDLPLKKYIGGITAAQLIETMF
jgi:lipoate-protein ligase A